MPSTCISVTTILHCATLQTLHLLLTGPQLTHSHTMYHSFLSQCNTALCSTCIFLTTNQYNILHCATLQTLAPPSSNWSPTDTHHSFLSQPNIAGGRQMDVAWRASLICSDKESTPVYKYNFPTCTKSSLGEIQSKLIKPTQSGSPRSSPKRFETW